MGTRPFPLHDAFSLTERVAPPPIPAAGQATPDDDPILHTALGLTEQIRAAGDEIEAGRRLPREIAAAIQKAGVFGMSNAERLGRSGARPVNPVPRHRSVGDGRWFGRLVRDD